MIRFIDTFIYNLCYSQLITALPLIYSLHKSLGYYPFPGNGFITDSITSNHYEVFLPFLVQSPWTAPPELDPVLQFQFSDLI
jgi:hypothetical protein